MPSDARMDAEHFDELARRMFEPNVPTSKMVDMVSEARRARASESALREENERLVAQLADTHREDVYKNRARHIVAWLKAQANAEGKLARQGKPTNLVAARTIFTEAHNVALSIFEGKHDTPLAAPETRGEGEG